MYLRRLVIGAAALSLPLGLVGIIVNAPPVGAVVSANGTINCTAVAGSVKFSPALETTGDTNKDTSTVTVTLKSCTYTSTNIGTGTVTGTVKETHVTTTTNNTANACSALGGSVAASLVFTTTWKDSNGTALAPTKETFSGYDTIINGSGSTAHGGFDLPQDTGGTATHFSGSFGGTNTGATSESNSWVKQTVGQLTTACGSATTDGLTTLTLGQPGTVADPSHAFVG